MNFYTFASDSPFLTFFLVLIVSTAIANIVVRFLRHFTLMKHGYTPAHCDADGDFKEADSELVWECDDCGSQEYSGEYDGCGCGSISWHKAEKK